MELTYYNERVSLLTDENGRKYVVQLLGRTIKEVETDEFGIGTLTFDNGESERIYSINDFDSYAKEQIRYREVRIKECNLGIITWNKNAEDINNNNYLKRMCNIGQYRLMIYKHKYVVEYNDIKYVYFGNIHYKPHASIYDIKIYALGDRLVMIHGYKNKKYSVTLLPDEIIASAATYFEKRLIKMEEELSYLLDAYALFIYDNGGPVLE